MIPEFIHREKIPHKPGIYIFKGKSGSVLYVGKAIDLFHRVSSYFSTSHMSSGNTKVAVLIKQIRSLDTIIVESELEALILEANLIKKYLPRFNVRLVDDKDYLYIKVTKEKFPRIITARKKDLPAGRQGLKALKYFGPFPSSTTVKKTLKALRRVFPWCSNPPKLSFQSRIVKVNPIRDWKANWKTRSCFYYHLGLCPGPCAGKISQEDYRKIIKRFIKLMEGKKDELISDLQKEMISSSNNLDFEKAGNDKKTILGIEYLTSPNRIQNYLENPNYQEDLTQKGLNELKEVLGLEELPLRIEGYDVSNIQGKQASGSMVVLTNGEIDKSQYRKFKIRLSGKPNDYAMHKEMIARRINHKDWPYPQMFLIDGGKGQVSAVLSVLRQKSIDIPVFGLAKRMERIYDLGGNVIKLKKDSLSLRMVQKLRDESHRFAVKYHRYLRNKTFFSKR